MVYRQTLVQAKKNTLGSVITLSTGYSCFLLTPLKICPDLKFKTANILSLNL